MEITVDNITYYKNQVIGKGVSGNIYLGIDNITQKQVAVKIINMREIQTQFQQDFVKMEIKSLQLLDSPYVVKMVYCERKGFDQYIITEFCKDGDLDKHLKNIKNKLPELEAVKLFKQILYGIAEQFNKKILHRDLKPMNILLHEGRVKIADYGCSIMSDDPDLDNYTYSVGTLYYLSPKTLKERKYSEKNDLWALGVIFYQMIYGNPPFLGMSDREVLLKIKKPIDFNKLAPVSDNAKDFLVRILEVDESKRITLEEIKKHPLFQPFVEPQKCTIKIKLFSQSLYIEFSQANQWIQREIFRVENKFPIRVIVQQIFIEISMMF